jgi:predicted transcriptional regulator
MILNKHQILNGITNMPVEILEAEKNFANALNTLKNAKNELAVLESDLIVKSKKINGASDRLRAMQLQPYTNEKQDEIIRLEVLADIAKAEFNLKVNQFESYKLLARFLE